MEARQQHVLAVNAGSSSLKIALFRCNKERAPVCLAKVTASGFQNFEHQGHRKRIPHPTDAPLSHVQEDGTPPEQGDETSSKDVEERTDNDGVHVGANPLSRQDDHDQKHQQRQGHVTWDLYGARDGGELSTLFEKDSVYSRSESEPELDVDHAPSMVDVYRLLLRIMARHAKPKGLNIYQELHCICHRIVHGGTYQSPQLVTPTSLQQIELVASLAPLHNAAGILLIKTSLEVFKSAPNMAYFDTTFHRSIPLYRRTYFISPTLFTLHGLPIEKYGFHGLSYAYIQRLVGIYMGKKSKEDLNLVVLHLGSGCSGCAIEHGQSVDTSMGLTPLDGLPGGTRSGSVDPSILFQVDGWDRTDMEDYLNKKSGWAALTGTTDFALIAESQRARYSHHPPAKTNGHHHKTHHHPHAAKGPPPNNNALEPKAESPTAAEKHPDPQAPSESNANANTNDNANNDPYQYRLVFDMFVDRCAKLVASYFAVLGGGANQSQAQNQSQSQSQTGLVFAGGIGENSGVLRQAIVAACGGLLGLELDVQENESVGRRGRVVHEIGAKGSRSRVFVCFTDESKEMAWQYQEGEGEVGQGDGGKEGGGGGGGEGGWEV
ncbi:hypothetical protein MMC25_007739 [Agyrium rufum]|nr:hypothetical protein [Agyrium rufum]